MSDFREAMWGVVQTALSELDFDFHAYARKHFARLLETAADPRLRQLARGGAWRRRAELPGAARCVIIGGGVGGTSIAYHLAELGWDDVVLLERARAHLGLDLPLRRASSGQLRGSVSLTKMMMHSVELYRRLGEESEFDPGWVECGGIRLASSEERMEELRRQAGWAKTFGLPLELISAEEAKELFPLMSTDGVLGRGLAPDRRLPRPGAAHLRARRRRPPGRLPRLHLDPGDRIDVARRPGARRSDRARRRRGRGGGQRGRACTRPRSAAWPAFACR